MPPRSRGWWLWLVWLVASCHQQFRFDEPTPDAAPDVAALSADARSCDDAVSCGWRHSDDCRNGVCLECGEHATCTGRCDDGCRAECEAAADCTLAAGPASSVVCQAASCHLTVSRSSSVFCASGAQCQVQCLADCNVTCSNNSHCTLACGSDVAPRTVSGSDGCH